MNKLDEMEIQNNFDIFKIISIEPNANLNNINTDLMISNLTAYFKSVLHEMDCEIEDRKVPSFDVPHQRAPRAIWDKWLRRGLKHVGRFLGWSVVLTTAGTVGSNTAVWLDHYLGRNDYIFIQKQDKSCELFKFGCQNHLCWASCGARRASAGWCFTKDLTSNTNYTTPFGIVHNGKLCNHNHDCDSCVECGSECYIDNGV